jgi:group I intron endonuclease
MRKSGIYQIKNLTTGKFYIGSATNVNKRFTQHKDDLRKGVHDNRYLQNAWNKYGEQDFAFSVLEYCEKDKLLKLEQSWFNWTDCCNRNKGYNINPNAGSNLGIKFSYDARVNMSNGQKANLNINHLIKINKLAADANRGKAVPDNIKLKISKSLTGRKLKETHVDKVSISNREYVRRKRAANILGVMSMGM